jgi:tetratricopeptide (TPR) repeat protein
MSARQFRVAVTVLAVLAFTAAAQPRRIEGRVTDVQGRPVAGASVEITIVSVSDDGFTVRRTDPQQTKTDENGDFRMSVSLAGTYRVIASKEGVGTDRLEVAVRVVSVVRADLRLWTPTPAREISSDCVGVGSDERSGLVAGAEPALGRLLGWLQAVQLHTPGCPDRGATGVGRWSQRELEMLLRDVRELVKFLQRVEQRRAEFGGAGSAQRDQLIFFIHNRRFTVADLFYGKKPLRTNELLRRGAVLHADIAEFAPGDLGGEPLVEDGERKGWRRGTVHYEIGRAFLDLIVPSPSVDDSALLWYRAISAYLFKEGRLAEVFAHLDKARQVFPKNPVVLLDNAYLHQELSSPAIEAATLEVRAQGNNVAVGSRRTELQRAERFFREVLALTPGDANARLRLGYTLGELGRHEDAVAELRGAIDAKPEEHQRYLTELFLGRQYQALRRRDDARLHFENAAALYPSAQSPRLALAYLVRQSGDRAAASRLLRDLPVSRTAGLDRIDPWWTFYEPHLDDAAALMGEMRKIGNTPP